MGFILCLKVSRRTKTLRFLRRDSEKGVPHESDGVNNRYFEGTLVCGRGLNSFPLLRGTKTVPVLELVFGQNFN